MPKSGINKTHQGCIILVVYQSDGNPKLDPYCKNTKTQLKFRTFSSTGITQCWKCWESYSICNGLPSQRDEVVVICINKKKTLSCWDEICVSSSAKWDSFLDILLPQTLWPQHIYMRTQKVSKL